MSYNKHWKEYTNPDFIGVYSFLTDENGTVTATPKTLTITGVKQEEVTGDGGKKDTKLVVSFSSEKKRMIFNATNSKAMVAHFGDAAMFPANWVGKTITVNAVKVLERREWVWRMQIIGGVKQETQKQKEELHPTHPRWESAVKALRSGNTTLKTIEKVFLVTDENKEELLSQATATDEAI